MVIAFYFGGPACQRDYDSAPLSDRDRERSRLPRAPRAELDWQVSRVVAAALRKKMGTDKNAPVALSHSHGHALVGLALTGCSMGVDLERCSSRDVDAYAQWVCTAEEQTFLQSQENPFNKLQQFYVLWTAKEALLKACGLSFPADMTKVGLDHAGTPMASLRAPQGQWQAMVWQLADDWIAAAAWPLSSEGEAADIVQWHSPERRHLLGHWYTTT